MPGNFQVSSISIPAYARYSLRPCCARRSGGVCVWYVQFLCMTCLAVCVCLMLARYVRVMCVLCPWYACAICVRCACYVLVSCVMNMLLTRQVCQENRVSVTMG